MFNPMPKEAAENTARAILDAAVSVLARRGITATTIREVAKAAGVSVGLVNYHFKSKQALLHAVVDASRTRFLGALDTNLPQCSGPEMLRRLLEMNRSLVDWMPDWFRLTGEIDALGLRDPGFRAAAAASKRRGAADVRVYVEIAARALGQPNPTEAGRVADVLLAAFDGVATRRLLDPAFDLFAAYVAIERMLLAELAPGTAPVARAWDPDPLGLAPKRRRRAGGGA